VLLELALLDLELRLKAGDAARVEEYLARYPELAASPANAVELIAVEFELRRRSEPGPFDRRVHHPLPPTSRRIVGRQRLANGPRRESGTRHAAATR